MSSTVNTGDVVETYNDGITVTKRFTADEFPVPAIRFEFTSEYNEPVSVRLSETIPETFPMDGVGFHPDYHSDQWTAFEDHRVEFTGTVGPSDSLVTVYGVRIEDEAEANQFLTEPSIVDVSPIGDASATGAPENGSVEDTMIGSIISDDRNQVVKDMLVGDAEYVPGLGDDAETHSKSGGTGTLSDGTSDDSVDVNNGAEGLNLDLGNVDVEPVDVPEERDDTPDIEIDFGEESIPDAAEAASGPKGGQKKDDPKIELDVDAGAASSAESTVSDASRNPSAMDGSTVASATSGSIAEALASEIRRGSVDDDDLSVIADELGGREERDEEGKRGVIGGTGGSDVARLDHLQSRIDEVAAYTGALETFLDEHGTGAQLIDTLESDLETLRSEVSDTVDRLETTESTVDTIDDQVGSLTEDVDTVERDVRKLSLDIIEIDDDVDSLEADVEGVEQEVAVLSDELDSVRDEVTDIVEWRNQLGSMFSDR